jgi:uncharacterized paraquat-inducible protein A
MPYTSCLSCHLTVYSSARHSTVDECPRCHSRLRPIVNIAAVRELQRTFADRDSLTKPPQGTAT